MMFTRLLAVSEQNAQMLDARLSKLCKQTEKDHQHLQDLITETQTRQTVLIQTIDAMEAQVAQIPTLIAGGRGIWTPACFPSP